MEEEQSATDHDVFLRLITKFEGNSRAFVASLLPTREGIDDVIQESSIVLWRKFAGFAQTGVDSDFLGRAFMIARYEVLKYRQRRATDRLQLSEDAFELLASEGEPTCTTQIERQLALHECVKELESKELGIVKAVYEDGARINDVAEQIGRTPPGVYKSVARIRERLANCVRTSLCVFAALRATIVLFAVSSTTTAEVADSIDFRNDLIPLFTKHGCNAGAYHGAAIGRGGFKLSLYGGDPQADSPTDA